MSIVHWYTLVSKTGWSMFTVHIFAISLTEFHRWGGNTVAAAKWRQVLGEEVGAAWHRATRRRLLPSAPAQMSPKPSSTQLQFSDTCQRWLPPSYSSLIACSVFRGRCPGIVFFLLKSEIGCWLCGTCFSYSCYWLPLTRCCSLSLWWDSIRTTTVVS